MSANFEISGEAVDGNDAIMKYKELAPDLVTMDITMPELDGISALKKIKELDPKAKIIMISAVGQESNVKQSIIAGACDFILKPFQAEDVVKKITKFI
jgi:two-component system chemotaxis response regulator CheY